MKTLTPIALYPLVFLAGCSEELVINENAVIVMPSAETTPVQNSDDAADDPAIWVNSKNPGASLILGTDKQAGLAVYDLSGSIIQFLDRGRLNNVDLRQDFSIAGETVSLAVATNRTENSLDIFTISNDGHLNFVLAQPLEFEEPYGVCMSKTENGEGYAFVNDKSGAYQQWLISADGQINPTKLGDFAVESQPEGCVVHDTTQTLYLGEENRGIWTMPADSRRASEMRLIDDIENDSLTADVEGMDIYLGADGIDWLVVSSQGDNSYALYDLATKPEAFVGSFRVVDNSTLGVDGSEETDGLAVTSANLGGQYSSGLLVVQDGFNKLPDENQNFKLVAWSQIQANLLSVD